MSIAVRSFGGRVQSKPQVKKPQVKKPQVKKPEIKRPEIKRPEVKRPEIKRPEVNKPQIGFGGPGGLVGGARPVNQPNPTGLKGLIKKFF